MKAQDFDKTLRVFKGLQEESPSPILQEATVRKFGGGRWREIKTLHILLSVSVRPGQKIPVYVWVKMICTRWNEALLQIADEAGESIHRANCFTLDNETVSVTVQGMTLKVSANMVEKEQE